MITYPGAKSPYVVDAEKWRAGRPRSKPATTDTVTKLSPGAGLLLAVLMSLGLWTTIWKAVSSVTPGWPG
jgi:hypothetical protein